MTAASKNSSAHYVATDAIALLIEDHKAVQKQFKAFEKLKQQDGDEEEKGNIVREVCAALTIHAQIEEEVFYPAVREAIGDDDLMDEAQVEHMGAKDAIAQLQDMQPGDDLFDARFTVLGEYVAHHIQEEQDEMFPRVKKAKVDTAKLGVELLRRKQELEAQLGVESDDEEVEDASEESAPQQAKKPAHRAAR